MPIIPAPETGKQQKMLNEIKDCEVCGNRVLVPVLDLGMHPMCDDLVPIGDTRICRQYPIEILFCEKCCTAHQRFQIPKQELFPRSYHYRARHTADVLNGMREFVATCEKTCGPLSELKVLDIGCNDGSLLSIFREKGARTFGIEPTGACEDAVQAGHTAINDFFTGDIAQEFVRINGKPDIITFTNVFAHIEGLADVIQALKVLKHDRTVIVIENHYLGSVLEKFQFDTFYHEHPRTYSYTSFAFIGDALGMQIAAVEFPPRYNGNIRVVYTPRAGQGKHAGWDTVHPREKSFGRELKTMSERLVPWKKGKLEEITLAVRKYGRLSGKAFPGRAAIPVRLLGLDETHIRAVYEKPQSNKVGHYIPGTRIPILSDDEFDPAGTDAPLINLAWHISREIRNYMQSRGYRGPILDIISPEVPPR
ncbi:MAG: class I SAM-dependent methyltransferase [Pseudomonadota bacterium]|nr:class I SAM-dependent methyltransferase [Pseudomonadota bacterium]